MEEKGFDPLQGRKHFINRGGDAQLALTTSEFKGTKRAIQSKLSFKLLHSRNAQLILLSCRHKKSGGKLIYKYFCVLLLRYFIMFIVLLCQLKRKRKRKKDK